jgi:adenylate cyclase
LGDDRRLAAVVFTDIVDYTILTQRDESLALQLLQRHNGLMRRVLARHRGKEIKTIGDAFLIEFGSALEATEFAIEVQQELHLLNAHEPPEERILIRVGIHVGDVVERGGDIFGDTVNVASRLHPLSEPGGICLSEEVFVQVRNKIPYQVERLPAQELKHVELPMNVYRVILPSDFGGGEARLWPRNRIAVLPLVNISPDSRDGYLADGMTEELITVLSQVQGLRVIARTSVDHFKGKDKRVSQIAEELGVGVVMEGSVRKAGEKVRITVQLVDAGTEEHIWSSSYDRELTDVFSIQSDIARAVADVLRVKLLEGDQERIESRVSENVTAYMAYLRGRTMMQSRTREGLREAEALFEEATRLDPGYALAYAGLADCHYLEGDYHYSPMPAALAAAKGFVSKALELAPDLAEAHSSLGLLLMQDYRFDEAEKEFRRAISLNRSYAAAHQWYAICLTSLGRVSEAAEEALQAEREDPLSLVAILNAAALLGLTGRKAEAEERLSKAAEIDPDNPLVWSQRAYYLALGGDYGRSIELMKNVIQASPLEPSHKAALAFIYAKSGDLTKAREILEEVNALPDDLWGKAALLSMIYFALNELDEAFRWAKVAVEQKSISIGTLRTEPLMQPCRDDPRFAELLKAAGLSP